jgi:hypothetical protein
MMAAGVYGPTRGRIRALQLELLEDRLTPMGMPLAGYEVLPPAQVLVGEPFSLQVRPVDANSSPFPLSPGSVVFASSDSAATLPASFNFENPANLVSPAGWYTISGFTLRSVGEQSIFLTQTGTEIPITGSTSVHVASNAPPTGLELIHDQDEVVEGGLFTLTGTFFEPNSSEPHTVVIEWGDGKTTALSLAPGASSFTASHVYTDGLPPFDPATLPISVRVRDGALQETGAVTSILVRNIAPDLAVGEDEFVNEGEVFRRLVTFSDPGSHAFLVAVDYGDGSPAQILAVGPDRTFLLEHVYPEEGSYLVVMTMTDGRGGSDVDFFFVDVLLNGVPTDPAVKEKVDPGETEIVEIPGVSVAYTRHSTSVGQASVIVAFVPTMVADLLDGVVSITEPFLASFDVRALNVHGLDKALVTFRYASTEAILPILHFFDRTLGRHRRVESSLYIVDPVARTITLLFDGRSNPSLASLTGTVFSIAVPIEQTVPTTSSENVQATFSLDGNKEGLAATDQAQVGTESVTLVSAYLPGPGTASAFRGSASGGASADDSASATDNGPLRDLPVVPPVVFDLPSVTLTPAGTEPPGPVESSSTELGRLPPGETPSESTEPVFEEDHPELILRMDQETVPTTLHSDAVFEAMTDSAAGDWKRNLALVTVALGFAGSRRRNGQRSCATRPSDTDEHGSERM